MLDTANSHRLQLHANSENLHITIYLLCISVKAGPETIIDLTESSTERTTKSSDIFFRPKRDVSITGELDSLLTLFSQEKVFLYRSFQFCLSRNLKLFSKENSTVRIVEGKSSYFS